MGEAMQWAMGVASDDADSQCRALARHALAIFDGIMKEVNVCKGANASVFESTLLFVYSGSRCKISTWTVSFVVSLTFIVLMY